MSKDVAGADGVLGGEAIGVFALGLGIEAAERFAVVDDVVAAARFDLRAAVAVLARDAVKQAVVRAGDVEAVTAGVGDFDVGQLPIFASQFSPSRLLVLGLGGEVED